MSGIKRERRRSARIEKVEKKRRVEAESLFPEELDHFGRDASPFVAEAMGRGGKLPKERRGELEQLMISGRLKGGRLREVVPKSYTKEIKRRFDDKRNDQQDMRSGHHESERYDGGMFTTTYVRGQSWQSDEKKIPEPLSPRPHHLGKREAHRAHTSPYSLGGPETNSRRTVWAPQWANLGVDGRMESGARAERSRGRKVVHFRFDTDTRSTVGFVSKSEKGTFRSSALQYRRRPE